METSTEIVKNLNNVLRLAGVDFSRAYEVTNGLYKFSLQDQYDSSVGHLVSKLEEATAEMQYFDIFTQRIQHLTNTHKKVVDLYSNDLFRKSLLHLQSFQLTMIELDLHRSVSIIKSALTKLEHFLPDLGDRYLDVSLFVHHPEIITLLKQVNADLMQEAGDIKLLRIPPLTKEQTKLLTKVYTMESERIVLNWFMRSMPFGTWPELLVTYTSQLQKLNEETIELF
jgi:hypothetical protein